MKKNSMVVISCVVGILLLFAESVVAELCERESRAISVNYMSKTVDGAHSDEVPEWRRKGQYVSLYWEKEGRVAIVANTDASDPDVGSAVFFERVEVPGDGDESEPGNLEPCK